MLSQVTKFSFRRLNHIRFPVYICMYCVYIYVYLFSSSLHLWPLRSFPHPGFGECLVVIFCPVCLLPTVDI